MCWQGFVLLPLPARLRFDWSHSQRSLLLWLQTCQPSHWSLPPQLLLYCRLVTLVHCLLKQPDRLDRLLLLRYSLPGYLGSLQLQQPGMLVFPSGSLVDPTGEHLPNDPHKAQSSLLLAQSNNPLYLVSIPGLPHEPLQSVPFLPLVKDGLDRLLPVFPLAVSGYTDPFPLKVLVLLLNDTL